MFTHAECAIKNELHMLSMHKKMFTHAECALKNSPKVTLKKSFWKPKSYQKQFLFFDLAPTNILAHISQHALTQNFRRKNFEILNLF
jgi:hypothetical protein